MTDRLVWRSSAVLFGGLISVLSEAGVTMILLAFIVLLSIRLSLFWKPTDFYGKLCRPEVILLICALLAGFIYGFQAEKIIPAPMVVHNIKVEGRLTDWVVEEGRARGTITPDKVVTDGEVPEEVGKKYIVKVYPGSKGEITGSWDGIKPGDRISFTAKLEHPQYPGTVGEFNLPVYYAVRGLSGSLTARGEPDLLEEGSPPASWILRQRVRTVLDRYWPQDAPILQGIMFGDSSGIPAETLNMYKAAGVMHIFAASGANVAFVIALFWTLFFFLPRESRIVLTLAAVIFYAFLCQGNPPILRATILGTAVLLGKLGRGNIPSLRWLMLAALILFFWNPLFLRDVSFQLSFAAAWGIVVISPQLVKSRILKKIPSIIRIQAAVAFGVQIAALPIMIEVFSRVSVAGFVTNVFMLVILGTALQLGLIGTFLIVLPVIPLFFFQASFWLLALSDHLLSFFSSLPFAYLWVLNPGLFFWVLWYGLIAVMLIGRQKVWFIFRVQLRKLYWFVSVLPGVQHLRSFFIFKKINSRGRLDQAGINKTILAVAMLMVLLIWAPWQAKEELRVTFLDVGQGDCILIRTPEENLLVDTGPRTDNFDAGERIIVPFLMKNRIRQLDMLFITHEHSDHLGGAGYILANIPTKGIAVPVMGDRIANEEWQEGLWRYLPPDSDKLIKLRAGDRLRLPSGITVEVLSPREILKFTSADANNNSLVLLLEYEGIRILLTGDMEREQMESMSERGADWNAAFIKIPHHGARGSFAEEWFDRTNPQAVFISVGRNSFGHPSPEVLSYWKNRGVPVYRTDLHGTIELVIDNGGFDILTGR